MRLITCLFWLSDPGQAASANQLKQDSQYQGRFSTCRSYQHDRYRPYFSTKKLGCKLGQIKLFRSNTCRSSSKSALICLDIATTSSEDLPNNLFSLGIKDRMIDFYSDSSRLKERSLPKLSMNPRSSSIAASMSAGSTFSTFGAALPLYQAGIRRILPAAASSDTPLSCICCLLFVISIPFLHMRGRIQAARSAAIMKELQFCSGSLLKQS